MEPDSGRFAALFRNGRSQAVRIPKEFELEGDRVRITKEGKRVILEPIDAPKRLLAVLAALEPLREGFPDVDGDLGALDEPEV
jgi:antitoxin VapB